MPSETRHCQWVGCPLVVIVVNWGCIQRGRCPAAQVDCDSAGMCTPSVFRSVLFVCLFRWRELEDQTILFSLTIWDYIFLHIFLMLTLRILKNVIKQKRRKLQASSGPINCNLLAPKAWNRFLNFESLFKLLYS